ncbi:MAG TPA: hypothetical protein VN606_07715 [Thermoleophilaceae bacterium]|nr:hypothetical protein [Thermoleophilaceae bacterium]
MARAGRFGRLLVPRRVRRGPSSDAYELVARTERRNIRSGKESFISV